MPTSKREQRRQIVQALVSLGIEKKRAHSEAGYMLNRWPFPAVLFAAGTCSKTALPLQSIKQTLSDMPHADGGHR